MSEQSIYRWQNHPKRPTAEIEIWCDKNGQFHVFMNTVAAHHCPHTRDEWTVGPVTEAIAKHIAFMFRQGSPPDGEPACELLPGLRKLLPEYATKAAQDTPGAAGGCD